jgi:hypothetical protein
MPLAATLLHRLNGFFARSDLPPSPAAVEPALAAAAAPVDHLGPYAPLVDAIRDELATFAATHVRLHLAIAETDRFLLTAVLVASDGDAEARRLLQRFGREFRPEQVKRFLAREVVAGLPNAGAIDLSQFEGLVDGDAARADPAAAAAAPYAELLALLADDGDAPTGAAWRVQALGRWVADDGGAPRAEPAPAARSGHPARSPQTPLAGQRQAFDVEDAAGSRRVVLQGVLPGRRFVVGAGEGADLRVEGTYASRRHAELWLEAGRWHVADAGSTNGVRLESGSAVVDPARGPAVVAPGTSRPLDPHGRLVLSARSDGPPRDVPVLALVAREDADAPGTPSTPIAPARAADPQASSVAPTSVGIAPPEGRSPVAPDGEGTGDAQATAPAAHSAEPADRAASAPLVPMPAVGAAGRGAADRSAVASDAWAPAGRAADLAHGDGEAGPVPSAAGRPVDAPAVAARATEAVARADDAPPAADAPAVAPTDAPAGDLDRRADRVASAADAGERAAEPFLAGWPAPSADAAAGRDGPSLADASPAATDAPRTPRTAILVREGLDADADADDPVASLPPLPAGAFRLTVSQAGAIRTVDLDAAALPVSIGRSRACTLSLDRRHESVSGRHLEIAALDEAGAAVRVLGDNGLAIEGVLHGAGATVHWPWGAIAELAPGAEAACTLLLTRAWKV